MRINNRDYLSKPLESFLHFAATSSDLFVDFIAAVPHIQIDHYTYEDAFQARECFLRSDVRINDYLVYNYGYSVYSEPGSQFYTISKMYYENSIRAAKVLSARRIIISDNKLFLEPSQEVMLNRKEQMLNDLQILANRESIELINQEVLW